MLTCQFQRPGLKSILQEEERLWPLSRVPDVHIREKLENILNNAERCCKALMFLASLLMVLVHTACLFSTDLPLGTQNFENLIVRSFYQCMQVICICHATIYAIAIQMMIFFGSMANLVVQYEVVKSAIKDLKLYIQQKDYQKLHGGLVEIVEHHLYLRR